MILCVFNSLQWTNNERRKHETLFVATISAMKAPFGKNYHHSIIFCSEKRYLNWRNYCDAHGRKHTVGGMPAFQTIKDLMQRKHNFPKISWMCRAKSFEEGRWRWRRRHILDVFFPLLLLTSLQIQ